MRNTLWCSLLQRGTVYSRRWRCFSNENISCRNTTEEEESSPTVLLGGAKVTSAASC